MYPPSACATDVLKLSTTSSPFPSETDSLLAVSPLSLVLSLLRSPPPVSRLLLFRVVWIFLTCSHFSPFTTASDSFVQFSRLRVQHRTQASDSLPSSWSSFLVLFVYPNVLQDVTFSEMSSRILLPSLLFPAIPSEIVPFVLSPPPCRAAPGSSFPLNRCPSHGSWQCAQAVTPSPVFYPVNRRSGSVLLLPSFPFCFSMSGSKFFRALDPFQFILMALWAQRNPRVRVESTIVPPSPLRVPFEAGWWGLSVSPPSVSP